MNKIYVYVFLILSSSFSASCGYAQVEKYIGTWEGIINVGAKIRFVLNISEDGKKGLKTIAESPDQTSTKIPCDSTIVDDSGITVNISIAKASYHGKLINDTTLEGTFTQAASLPLVLIKKSTSVLKSPVTEAPVIRPQTPKPPFPYESYDVEYDNAGKTVHLAGTLTVPKTQGSISDIKITGYPAVVIISGSGPQDRDGTLFGHTIYWVLADHLSRNGIAVLRVDDRGVGKSTAKNIQNSTSADFADDVAASVEFLKTRKEINKNKIGLIGHSEGGIIAPMLAAKRKDIAFIVLWGAPVSGGKITNTEQNEMQLKKSGIDSISIRAFRSLHLNALQLFETAKDSADLATRLQPVWEQWKTSQPKDVLQALAVNDNSIVGQNIYASYNSLYEVPWFRFFLTYDPAIDLAKVRVPILAINGSKDTQVDAQSNLKLISDILKKNKNKNFEVHNLPSLNHLLQTAKTGGLEEYGTISETIAPPALELITDWIKKKV